MAFKLNGNTLPLDVPFTVGDINYPANWLRYATTDEKTAIGITEVADPDPIDGRFYNADGSAKSLTDTTATFNGVEHTEPGVKTVMINYEKKQAAVLLAKYDWQVVRKTEKGTAMDSAVVTYRDGIRTAYETEKSEINACSDIAAMVTLYGATFDSDGNFVKMNMTQYPEDPYPLS